MAESRFPGSDVRIWLGLMVPAGTPAPVIRQIELAIAKVLKDPTLRKTLEGQGWDIASGGAQHFEDFLKVELPKLAQSARSAKVKAD